MPHMEQLLEQMGAQVLARHGETVSLYLCRYNGLPFNVKVSAAGQADIWTYSRQVVRSRSRKRILDLLGAFERCHPLFRAYINEDGLIIISLPFALPEGAGAPARAVRQHTDLFLEALDCGRSASV